MIRIPPLVHAVLALLAALPLLTPPFASAQAPVRPAATPLQELHRLEDALHQTEAEVAASQQQLAGLKASLAALERRLGAKESPGGVPVSPGATSTKAPFLTPAQSSIASPALEDVQERQAMQESQIATLDQAKVESESRYPVKLSGLILLTGFTNTSAVDTAPAPATAVPGSGSTGWSLRQTILGLDARGPHLAGATSRADVRVDFFGNSTQTTYADVGGLLRLRTAHAVLAWKQTDAFAEIDRPILSPDTPSSLVSVAQPALAWSGNLWSWIPQVGASHTFDATSRTRLKVTAALADAPDPPALTTANADTVSGAEGSRWPGTEVHIGISGTAAESPSGIGVGGYFSPHKITGLSEYDAWAATLDARTRLPFGLHLTTDVYRGAALGGLGGGSYKDYVVRTAGNRITARALDDVGGWAQLSRKATAQLNLNAAFGMDNAFAKQLRAYPLNNSAVYSSLARNRTFFVNAIFQPSAYLQFSMEYRRILTSPITGPASASNVVGVAAGYSF